MPTSSIQTSSGRAKALRLVIGAVVIALSGVVAVRLSNSPRSSQIIRDGSILTLVDAKVGMTNSFLIGDSSQRLLARFIPSNGLNIVGFKLSPPSKQQFVHPDGESLVAIFRLSRASLNTNLFLDESYNHPECRILLPTQSGHEYEGYLSRFRYLRVGSNYYAFTMLAAFPRDQRWLDLKVVAEKDGTREVLAEFKLKNPAPHPPRPWKAEQTPIKRQFGNLKITLGEVTTSPRLPSMRTPQNPFETGSIPLHVIEDGAVSTNWCLHDISARDDLGNIWHHGATTLTSNDWRYCMIWSGLDPARIWKLEAHLARDSGFPADTRYSVRLKILLTTAFQTNFNGVPVRIQFINQDMLAVQMLTNRPDLRLSFISATHPSGLDLDRHTGNWGQWHFWRAIEMPPRGEEVKVTCAIHTNFPLSCLVEARPKQSK